MLSLTNRYKKKELSQERGGRYSPNATENSTRITKPTIRPPNNHRHSYLSIIVCLRACPPHLLLHASTSTTGALFRDERRVVGARLSAHRTRCFARVSRKRLHHVCERVRYVIIPCARRRTRVCFACAGRRRRRQRRRHRSVPPHIMRVFIDIKSSICSR